MIIPIASYKLLVSAYAVCGGPVVKSDLDSTILEGLWDSKSTANISKKRVTNNGITSKIMT